MTHACIKCKARYESPDPDAYYCLTCIEERNAIAAEIDKKFANRPKKEFLTPLQKYDAAPKIRGFINARDLL